MKEFLSWYLPKLGLTILLVALAMGFLALMYNICGVWGVVGGFVGLIGLSIWHYNYTNKKEAEKCPLNKKN